MRRTCDAIASLDGPAQDYDRADKNSTGQERKRRRPCHRSSGIGWGSFPILSRSHIIGFPSGSIPPRNESGFRLDPVSISASVPAQYRSSAYASRPTSCLLSQTRAVLRYPSSSRPSSSSGDLSLPSVTSGPAFRAASATVRGSSALNLPPRFRAGTYKHKVSAAALVGVDDHPGR